MEMVGKNAERLDISKDYPRLHPVFNVLLVVKYHSPNSLLQMRGLKKNITGMLMLLIGLS
jgi:hypothetical protein